MRPPVQGFGPQQPRGAADPSATRPAFMNNPGSEPNSPAVWTATHINGTFNPSFPTCNNWTSTTSVFGGVGIATSANSLWTEGGFSPCSPNMARLYCFQQ